MHVSLRPATAGDFGFLRGLSNKPQDDLLQAQIRDGRLRIIQHNGSPVGYLKFSVLWETLPFLEVIWLVDSSRQQGVGTAAIQAWEHEMTGKGFDLVLTSSAADETAQHFWRKLGYTDCGSLTVRGKPSELFLQKRLAA